MKPLHIVFALIIAPLLFAGCIKDIPNLNAGPINFKMHMLKQDAYSGPYCAVVTMRLNGYMKALGAEGFWYWGDVTGTALDNSGNELGSTTYKLLKFDGSTPAGSYGTEDKPFPVHKVGTNTTRFKVQYSNGTVWALNQCSGCVGIENLHYTPYTVPTLTDGETHECGYNYKLVLTNTLMP